nr:hypothetical protein [Tanacetum cinerariifolium]
MTMNELLEDAIAANIFEFLRFLMASGVKIGRGTALRPDEKKTAPITLDLSSESENLGSQPSDAETHHSPSPINTAPPDAYHVASVVHFEAGGSNQAPQSNENENENDDAPSGENVNAKVNRAGSEERAFASSFGGSGQNSFPGRNIDGDEGGSLRVNVALAEPFVPLWNLTTIFSLKDAEACRDMMVNLSLLVVQGEQDHLTNHQALQRAWFDLDRGALAQADMLQRFKALSYDYGELHQAHASCHTMSKRLTDTQNDMLSHLFLYRSLSEDHKNLQQNHFACVGWEAGYVNNLEPWRRKKKTFLIKIGSRQIGSRIWRRNMPKKAQLLPVVINRLHQSIEYKKSLYEPFNLAISIGWTKGLKAGRTNEMVHTILKTASGYDPECSTTFQSLFDSLFTKRYSYVEKVKDAYLLSLGGLQNLMPDDEGPTPGGGPLAD